MFSKLMRAVCVLLGVSHGILGLLALRDGSWHGAAESLAIVLLAWLVWFSAPPGSQQLERPRIGSRTLRLGLYYAVIALAGIGGLSYLFGAAGARGGAGSSTLLLLVLVLLVPLMNAERRDRATP